MSARDHYRLIVARGGHAPALIADPERADHVEVVEIDSGEVVLLWDCDPREASRIARELRRDLAQLDAEQFIQRWSSR